MSQPPSCSIQALSALLFSLQECAEEGDRLARRGGKSETTSPAPGGPDAGEVRKVFAHLHGTPRLMASLLYGSGLRLMEAVRLRVKDLDFGYARIVVRDGKGGRDRVTMLPVNLAAPLQLHLEKVRAQLYPLAQ